MRLDNSAATRYKKRKYNMWSNHARKKQTKAVTVTEVANHGQSNHHVLAG